MKRITSSVLFAVVPLAATMPGRVVAQSTCGWVAPPSTRGLPAAVETIIGQLPATWTEAPDAIANLGRWFRECDDPAGHKAIFAMQRALRRGIDSEALKALLGTSLLHGPEVQIDQATGITNRPTYQLSNAERDGARLLAHAATTDSKLSVAADELAEVALSTRHGPTVKMALDMLRTLLEHTPSGDQARTRSANYAKLAAELAIVAKDYNLARRYGASAIMMGDSSAYHAVGIARMLSGERDGANVYLRGVSSPGAIELYYDDLSYLLEPDDTLAWQVLPDPAKPDWIRKQWEWRAAISSQPVEERLQIHFQRLAHAIDYYPRTAFRTPPGTNAVVFDHRTRFMTLDDRGLIYVRHGEPDEIIAVHSVYANDKTRVAWGYRNLMSGRALFEFTRLDCPMSPRSSSGRAGRMRACGFSGDYYLATPVNCEPRGDPTVTFYDYAAEIYPYDPGLAQYELACFEALTARGGVSNADLGAELVHRSNAIIKGGIALRTESATAPFATPLDVAFMTYAMRNGHDTQVFGFASVSGDGVKAKAGTHDYAFAVHLSVENNRTLTASTTDTTFSFHTESPLHAGNVVRGSVATTALPAPNATVRLGLRNQNDKGQGQVVTTARPIPDFSTDHLAMSDLVIAETRDGKWSRGPIRLAPIPAHLVTAGSAFRLYYEVYGAQNGDSLGVQIILAPSDDPGILSQIKSLVERRNAKQIGFTDRAALDETGTARVVREIGADIKPGRYVVTVRIRNARSAETAEARTELTIVK